MVLDLIVLGILLVSTVVAFMRGFVREVLTIGSLGGAAVATLVFGAGLTPLTRGWLIDPKAAEPQTLFGLVPYEMLAPLLAYALTFGGVLIVLTVITHMVSKGVHAVGLGPVDRSLGVVFGLVRGVVIVGLLSLVLNFVLSDSQRETMFGRAKTYGYVSYLGELTQALLPGRDIVDKIKDVKDGGQTQDQKPLEPGQTSKSTGGYTASERKKIEDMVKDPDQKPVRTMKFNE